jgi:hypothetical protein
MRNILIIAVFVTCCQRLLAQEVIATAGSTLSNSNGSISFTIGESVANTLTKGDKTITQGFQQANISVSMVNELKDLFFNISVFPNPASNVLILKISKDDVTGIQYLLYDILGKLLLQKKLESNETSVPVNQLAKGLYILKVQEGMKELKTFKIIKK